MHEVVLSLTPELLREIEALAQHEERTRPAQIRYLLRLGLGVATKEDGKREQTRADVCEAGARV